jgi:hypothetical protein
MRLRSLPAALLTLAVSASMIPGSGAAQAAPTEDRGIWIADAGGNLRAVAPASSSFLRSRQGLGAGSVRLVLSVETFAESATGAVSAGQLAVARVRRAVGASGVTVADVSSELAYVEPRYQFRVLRATWEKPRRLGFDAAHVITLSAASEARLGHVIDAAMGAGATRVLDVQTPGEAGR